MFRSLIPTKKITRTLMMFLAILMVSHPAWADGPPVPSSMSNPFVVTMVIIIGILALAIGLLANVVLGAAFVRVKEDKEAEEKTGSKQSGATAAAIFIGLLLVSSTLFAQDKAAATSAPEAVANGVSDTAFYLITGVIFLELIVVIVLVYNLKLLLNLKRKESAVGETVAAKIPSKPSLSWWARFNKLRPIEQEANIDLGHNYDGIRELDNRLPPWWIYGFYCTIIFAGIYLWRYHVAHSAPLSGEEFQIAMQQAAVQKEEYLKKTANNIDETNVKYLSAAADLEAGKKVFETVCFACHGKGGEGLVGPNLTDDYWLHGGSIQDIFKTIKYGYPEKGMKSWKDDYSPIQIAEISSYVKSLRGTNPPNPKAPQGTLYTEGADGNSKPNDSGTKDTANPKTVVIR